MPLTLRPILLTLCLGTIQKILWCPLFDKISLFETDFFQHCQNWFYCKKELKTLLVSWACLCEHVWGRGLVNGGLWVFINWVWIFLKILIIPFAEFESFFQNHHITGEAIPCLLTWVSWWRGRFISYDHRICENLPLTTKLVGVSLLLAHHNILRVGDFYFQAIGAV